MFPLHAGYTVYLQSKSFSACTESTSIDFELIGKGLHILK